QKFKIVQLRPLDEPECGKYVAAHPEGGKNFVDRRGVERLYEKSQGIPVHLDRMIKELQTISIDELSEVEQEGALMRKVEPIPRTLIYSVRTLQESSDTYTRRSVRLLKVLTVLSQGETFKVLRRFNPRERFSPDNVEE